MNKNMKTVLVIGGIVVAILIVLPLVFGPTWGWRDGGWRTVCPFIWGGFGWGWFMPIFMILFGVLVIWGVVALVRGTSHPSDPASGSKQPDSALEVLKKRYARGEISKAEYEEKRNDIS
jgi:putative membrane protein